MPLHLLALAVGCLALYVGGDLLVRGSSHVGRGIGLSPALTGLLLVSFGTSAPELFVSAGAALQGLGDVAAGNALGSNIVNLCLVLGLGALWGALPIGRDVRDTQLPLMVAVTIASVLMIADGALGRLEGAALLLGTGLGLWRVTRAPGPVGPPMPPTPLADPPGGPPSRLPAPLALAVGIVVLMIGAEALIFGGVGLAAAFGVPEAVIALTVTSIGTGLPEITATVIAARRREHALAVGNVVGSNVLNLGLVLGGSALLRPIDSGGIGFDTLGVVLALSLGLWALAWRPGRIARITGIALLVGYALYVVELALR